MPKIENILSISGTVESGETKNYFSELAVPIDKVNVKVGDKVKAGDVLCTFDAENLDLQQQSAELAIKQAKGSYNSLYSPTGAADRKYAEGMKAQQINDRVDAITAEINALNDKITEKTNRMEKTLSDLNKTTLDLDQALQYILKETYDYLIKQTDYSISDMTRKAYEYYKNI